MDFWRISDPFIWIPRAIWINNWSLWLRGVTLLLQYNRLELPSTNNSCVSAYVGGMYVVYSDLFVMCKPCVEARGRVGWHVPSLSAYFLPGKPSLWTWIEAETRKSQKSSCVHTRNTNALTVLSFSRGCRSSCLHSVLPCSPSHFCCPCKYLLQPKNSKVWLFQFYFEFSTSSF